MPRRVQDIVPSSRKSIRNVPKRAEDIRSASEIRRSQAAIEKKLGSEIKRGEEIPLRRMPFTPPPPKKKKRSSGWKYLAAIGVVVIVAGLAYLLSMYFSHATFMLTAKTVPISVDSTYVAEGSSANGVLTYEVITAKGSASTTVPAVNGQAVSSKAQGKVTIYNAYGTASQRLVAGTRVANDGGLVYRLTGSVVVPGYTVSGGNKIPGTVSATISADLPGESYNIYRADDQSDFKILGFKGTPKYEGFYARANGDIAGGFTGTKKTVDAVTMASTTKNLQARITALLIAQAKNSVLADRIMYDNAYMITFSSPIISGSEPGKADVAMQGVLSAMTFKKTSLLDRIIGDKATATFGSASYSSPGLESLVLTISNAKDFSPDKKNTLIIKLKGEMKLVGDIPSDEIKKAVAGMSLLDTEKVLRKYTSVIDIEKSGGEVVPPWANVPSDLDRISVVVEGK